MMYGVPPGTDFGFLSGALLLQVCIGENEVILNLDRDISIMIASDVFVEIVGRPAALYKDSRSLAPELLPLVSQAIVDTTCVSNGGLCLTWGNGTMTTLLDTWKDFESYTVRHRERIIVV